MGYREVSQHLLFQIRDQLIKPVPLPHFQLLFKFSCYHKHVRWRSPENSTELRHQVTRLIELPSKTIQFNPQIVPANSKEKLFRALNRGLIGFRLSKFAREIVAMLTVEGAWDILVTSMSPSNNHLTLDIEFIVAHREEFYRRPVIQDPMESAGPTMIPTSQASIQSLESKIIDSSDECSICLQDFKVGCEGVCMPCSHMFHRNCITRWLRTSHYCPICRFQMPSS